MAEYRLLIGEDSDPDLLTLDDNVSFDIDAIKSLTGEGAVQMTTVNLTVRGNIVRSGPDLVMDRLIELTDEVLEKFIARRVRLQRDGVNEYDFQPSASFQGTPQVVAFRTIPEDGQGESHWRYELDIFVVFAGTLGQDSNTEEDIIELQTSLETIKNENDEVIRKIWRAAAKGETTAAAQTVVESFKPTSQPVTEDFEVFSQEARARAVWVWDAKAEAEDFEETFETIIVTGGTDFIVDPQVNAAGELIAPLLHRAAFPGVFVTIQGRRRSKKKDVQPPKRHYNTTENATEILSRETNSEDPTLADAKLGIYEIQYSEVWFFADGIDQEPDHSDHAEFKPKNPPADGPAGA